MFADKRRGDIWWMSDTHRKPQDTCLIRGDRPVVIVSSDIINQNSNLVLVAPMTSSPGKLARGDGYCDNVLLLGYGEPSIVLPRQLLCIDRSDLQYYVGRLADVDMARVDAAMGKVLGLR